MYYDDYLEHHGIKGMKWGIRRFQNDDGSYTSAGLNRYGYDRSLSKGKGLIGKYKMASGQKVAYKLNNMSNERKRRMSARQKESYNNAKKYWEARALGQKTPKRNIIKRYYDKSRADSFGVRTAKNVAKGVVSGVATPYISRGYGKAVDSLIGQYTGKRNRDFETYMGKMGTVSYSTILKSSVTSAGYNAISDELLNKIFGHY